ncbi:MAG TPA: hypothetical protein VH092_18805 [Urbifossiella sp.]|nr:hypothetical protein [Urbifossiella sp.]
MSTTPPPAARTGRRRWAAFWFTPTDPTTLGFMRLVTGLLVLYIHLAYCLDFRGFFGKYGWYGQAYIDRERHEYPWVVGSFTDWANEDAVMARLPEFPHRRQSVMRFIRGLPGPTPARAAALRFLDRAVHEPNPNTVSALTFLMAFHETGKGQEERVYTALAEGRQLYGLTQDGQLVYLSQPPAGRESTAILPDFLRGLPEPDRAAAAADLRAFMAVLPPDPADTKYLINHLLELDQAHRLALVKFLVELPDDPAGRAKLVDYLEYWNNDPAKAHHLGQRLVSVWFHVTDPGQMAAIHGTVLVIILLFALGVCTRVTGVLTWIATVGYIHRTNQILFGMDTMMNILLAYLVVGNSGAALSVDRLVARYRAARASLARCGRIDDATRAFLDRPPPSAGAGLGIRLIQVHFCFIYLAAGLSKLKGPGWWTGFAFWDVMVNPEFTLMRYEWFENFVRWGASSKPVYHAATAFGVWFTWGLEICFPFLVWTRLRPVVLWMGVLLHAGIGVLMGLNLFELLMMVMMLVFMPVGVIRDRLRGGPGLPRLGFGFDPGNPAHARAAALVAAADADGQVTLDGTKGVDQPAVRTADKSTLTGPAAAGGLFDTLRLLRLVRYALVLPGVAGLAACYVSPAPAAQPPVPVGS